MWREAALLLLDALVQPYAAVLLLRFHAAWLHVPMRNPIGEFVMAITDFVVLPLRRRLPAVWGLDWPTLWLALGVEFLYLVGFLWVQGYPYDFFPLAGLLAWSTVKLLKLSLYLLMASLLAEALLSWVNPHTPVAPLLAAFNRPLLRPLRRHIPLLGGVDLSPLVAFLLCQLLLIAPVAGLEQATQQWL